MAAAAVAGNSSSYHYRITVKEKRNSRGNNWFEREMCVRVFLSQARYLSALNEVCQEISTCRL